ncbi:hypothetical protein [Litoreibacter albidus]|uniref:hypothetical protein n=1 Tax=Litoreibacter albidus TaxID=670155 RepID=UPI000B7DB59F|nr:hypothetical protein [Litoreibacter albidus]
MVLLAGFILFSFGEPLAVAIAVMVPFLVLIFLLGWVEATHLDIQKMEADFRKNKRLRSLPDGFLAYDNYWKFGWGKDAKIPRFGWRNWFDGAVLAAIILAMSIGAAVAFTSSGNIFNIPPQWGMATTAILVALLLRSVATSFFAQLTFLRYLERPSK